MQPELMIWITGSFETRYLMQFNVRWGYQQGGVNAILWENIGPRENFRVSSARQQDQSLIKLFFEWETSYLAIFLSLLRKRRLLWIHISRDLLSLIFLFEIDQEKYRIRSEEEKQLKSGNC